MTLEHEHGSTAETQEHTGPNGYGEAWVGLDAAALERSLELLRTHLPEFSITLLGERNPALARKDVTIACDPKIVIQLPEGHPQLRIGLIKALYVKTGLNFHQDARATDAACIGGHPETVLRALTRAIREEKLQELSMTYLEENTPESLRNAALNTRVSEDSAEKFQESGAPRSDNAGQGEPGVKVDAATAFFQRIAKGDPLLSP